jgi:hypothetical protein
MTEWGIEKALMHNFWTSAEAFQQTDDLRQHLGFADRASIARMAIGRSLGEKNAPPRLGDAKKSKPIKGETLFGFDDISLWIALIVANWNALFPKEKLTLETLSHMAVSRHWSNDIRLLMADWQEANGYSKFVEILMTRRANLPARVSANSHEASETLPETILAAHPVRFNLGEEENGKARFIWTVNGEGYSPHMAVMGQTGSGKTRTMLDFLKQVQEQAHAPVFLVDLGKGDLADDPELVRQLGAKVLRVPQDSIPLNMFHGIGDLDSNTEANNRVIGLWESLSKLDVKGLGPVQKEHFREALVPLFSREKHVSFEQVRDRIIGYYDDIAFRMILSSQFNCLLCQMTITVKPNNALEAVCNHLKQLELLNFEMRKSYPSDISKEASSKSARYWRAYANAPSHARWICTKCSMRCCTS